MSPDATTLFGFRLLSTDGKTAGSAADSSRTSAKVSGEISTISRISSKVSGEIN
ncbi:MAG: hypothetical protein AB8E74_09395 [Prochlorococcus sp.]|nr:hypothetical protein [Prochlorococcaceae cyanobacterium Fu_MAG_50]